MRRWRRSKQTPAGVHWLPVTGRGNKLAHVALPPLAWNGRSQYLAERELPVVPVRWNPATPVIGNLDAGSGAAISSTRLWGLFRRFVVLAASATEADPPPLAAKLN